MTKHLISAAQFNIALAYSTGQGVEKSDTKMKYWYAKAAESGNTAAQLRMGFLNLGEGERAARRNEARRYFRMAAQSGDATAVAELRKIDGGSIKEMEEEEEEEEGGDRSSRRESSLSVVLVGAVADGEGSRHQRNPLVSPKHNAAAAAADCVA